MFRVMGLKPEKKYGQLEPGVMNPDFHRGLNSGDFQLNDEPLISEVGSRMTQLARAGTISPTGSSSGKADLKRIGHYLYAALDQYNYYDKANKFKRFKDLPDEYHIHEFYGGEDVFLHSFTGWVTVDFFMKKIEGLLLDSLKLEVSDEFMNQSEEWVYKNEKSLELDKEEYEKLNPCGAIPIASYDVFCKLGDSVYSDKEDPHIFKSLSFELKNNLNTDNLKALGSRFPKRQATAQKREVTVELTGNLTKEDVELIRAAEYGKPGINRPSDCSIYKGPVQFGVKICEKQEETLIITCPSCTLNVDYDLTESEEIETTFSLSSLGSKKQGLIDGDKVNTDIHILLVNKVPEISSAPSKRDLKGGYTENFIVNCEGSVVPNANIHVTGLTDSLEAEGKTNTEGKWSCGGFKEEQYYYVSVDAKDCDHYEAKILADKTHTSEITLQKRSYFDLLVVVGDSSEVIEGADICLKDDKGHIVFDGFSDCAGQGMVEKLKKGIKYNLSVSKEKYKAHTQEVSLTKDLILKITLSPENEEENKEEQPEMKKGKKSVSKNKKTKKEE